MNGAEGRQTAGFESGRATPGSSEHAGLVVSTAIKAYSAQRRRTTALVVIYRLVIVAAVLLTWQYLIGFIVDQEFVSTPSAILKIFVSELFDGTLVSNAKSTLLIVVLAYVGGSLLAAGLAMLVSINQTFVEITRPYVSLLYATPNVALAPLLIMWFGLGIKPKVIVAGIFVFFVVFVSTLSGLTAPRQGLQNVASVMGARKLRILTKVLLPSALPQIFASLRISIPGAMVGAIVAEFLAGSSGLGYLIKSGTSQLNTATVFAALIAILIIVLGLDAILGLIERRVLRWRVSTGA